jgi:murein DD-endopeptidase MepM/ murein hydrolase activator NlpD
MGETRAMGRRLLALLGLVLSLVVVAPAAADDPTDEKASVDARIASLQADIAAAKTREGVLTSQVSAVVAELESAQSAVDDAEATVGALEAELTSARARLDELTERLTAQTRRLERLRSEYAKAVAILEARVRAAYIDEPPDMLAFLVSASSFDEVIDNVELLNRIGRQDRRIAHQVERARNRAAAERRATIATKREQAAIVSVIAARTDEARVARDRLAGERDRLAAVEDLKQSALTNSRETREEYLREVDSLLAQSAALAEQIRGAQRGAGTTGGGQPSAAGLIWPCDGVVVSGFGMRWGRMHEGIDIGCAYGTPNRAAAGGTVIHAGWLGGYGNLVVVDHGNGLSTAYAHASSILVSVGQSVSQGETVSLVGSTGNSSGPHLHFEVRVNGVAVDPLLYL